MGGYVHADEVFTASFNGSLTSNPDGYFTVVDGKVNYNTKYKGTYEGIIFDKGGLKLQSSTKVNFTTTAKATITVVQSISSNSGNLVALDGTALSGRTDDAANTVGVYVVKDVEAGSHTIARAKSECGILYIKVEYTGSTMTQLSNPVITYDETGNVTITQAESKDVYYTTDGSEPTADNGTKYENSFNVEDGTVVKAIAVGDGTKTIDSEVASVMVLHKTVTIETPKISSFNGTVAISCSTPNAKIEYTLDGGKTYNDYIHAFTLFEDATVKAKASRDNCATVESEEASVVAVKNNVATKTVVLDYNKFDLTDYVKGVSNSILKGKTDTDAEGYSLELNNNQKNWSALNKMTIDGTEYQSIKLSNGAENILHLPEGVKVARVVLYSVINSTDKNTVCGWQNVNGAQEYKSIPMGALTKYPSVDDDYDVRVYPLDNVTDQISFTNAGLQMAFVIALDIVDETPATTTDITIGTAKIATYCNTSAWEVPEGMEVYTATYADGKVTLNKVKETAIPANTGVVVYGEPKTYAAKLADSAVDLAEENALVAATEETTMDNNTTYILVKDKATQKVMFGQLASGQKVKANSAYLTINDINPAKSISIDFGSTTGINTIENTANAKDGEYYTLSGQRTMKPVKGIYILNGKKYIAK